METDLEKVPIRTTHAQLEGLLAFLCEHPSLAQGRKGSHVAEVWDICAEQLNAISNGDPLHQRTGKGWAKFWHDYKYRLKIRATELKIALDHDEVASTAQRKVPMLSDLERNILDLIDFDVPEDDIDTKIDVKSSGESNTSKDKYKYRFQVPEVQLDALLDFIQKHPMLAEGKSKLKKKGKLWEKCAEKLNGLHHSCHKDGKGWAQYWHNCKYKLKQLRKEMSDEDLPEFEQKILALTEHYKPVRPLKEEPDDEDEERATMSFVDVRDGDNFQYSPVPSDCSMNDVPGVSYTLKSKSKRRRKESDRGDDDDDQYVKRRKDTNKEFLEIEKQKLKLMQMKIESMNRLTDQISDMTTVLMDIRDRLPKP